MTADKRPSAHRHTARNIIAGTFVIERIPEINWTRIEDCFPRTIADLLSNHNKAVHDALNINADTLDTLHAAAFALASHAHAGEDITSGIVADVRIADTITRDSELTSAINTHAGLPDVHHATHLKTLDDHPLSIIPIMDDAHIPNIETLSYGGAFATAQIPNLDASKIASGVFDLARIPTMDDAHIPDIETLSYTNPFAVAQIPSLPASIITSGILAVARGGLGKELNPTWTDDYILVYDSVTDKWIMEAKGALAAHHASHETSGSDEVVSLAASVITSGTINLARIPTPLTGKSADQWDGYEFADYLDQPVKSTSNPMFGILTLLNNTMFLKFQNCPSTYGIILDSDLDLIETSYQGINHIALSMTSDYIYFGSARDTNLYRYTANILKTDDSVHIDGKMLKIEYDNPMFRLNDIGTSGKAWDIQGYLGYLYVGTDTLWSTFRFSDSGEILIKGDVNLYRSAANILKTDDALYVTGDITGNANVYFPNLPSSDDIDDIALIESMIIKDGKIDVNALPDRFKGGNIGALVGLLLGAVKQLNKKIKEIEKN